MPLSETRIGDQSHTGLGATKDRSKQYFGCLSTLIEAIEMRVVLNKPPGANFVSRHTGHHHRDGTATCLVKTNTHCRPKRIDTVHAHTPKGNDTTSETTKPVCRI
jgi:hypothetical protein